MSSGQQYVCTFVYFELKAIKFRGFHEVRSKTYVNNKMSQVNCKHQVCEYIFFYFMFNFDVIVYFIFVCVVLCCRHEGRTWYTPHRGRLWIAATAKAATPQEIHAVESQYREMGM